MKKKRLTKRIPQVDARAIGLRIRRTRKKCGWNLYDFEEVTGIRRKTLACYECGSRVPLLRNGLAIRKRYGREWKRVAVLPFVDQSVVPTLDEARTAVDEWITDYHHTSHSADDMGGMTPLEMWRTASTLRRADDDALLFLMHARGVYNPSSTVAFCKLLQNQSLRQRAGALALQGHLVGGRQVTAGYSCPASRAPSVPTQHRQPAMLCPRRRGFGCE